MTTPPLSRRHVALLAFAGGLSLIIIGTTVAASLTLQTYHGRILPGVRINGVYVGGLTEAEAFDAVEKQVNTMITGGLPVELQGRRGTVPLIPSGATDPDLIYPIINFDVAAGVKEALGKGRTGTLGQWYGPLFYPIFRTGRVQAPVSLATLRFAEAVRETFPNSENPGTPTDFVIIKTADSLDITVVPPTPGTTIDIDSAAQSLLVDAEDLNLTLTKLNIIDRTDLVTVAEAESLINDAKKAILNAPLTLLHQEADGFNYEYILSEEDLINLLAPVRNTAEQAVLGLDPVGSQNMLATLRQDLNLPTQNAEFILNGNRVTTFTPSRPGRQVDEEHLFTALEAGLISGPNSIITIPMRVTEPTISTADSNTLGIVEKLGTGYSAYKGSPANRRANIAHGLSKINGLLIAPGETFSLLAALRPFTLADGYLAELVIKGDEIKPEVGGGLCQIGSTTFRAAMNSGLEIAERRNHSLVVSYYNDPSNNQPGTDATIYDPAPDLKITNDTGHYVLLQTENNTETSELFFHFWGTSDGRKAYYTPPEVLSWSGYGAKVIKETDRLPPGKQECQAPHSGATTTFTYVIERPDGTKNEREFRSTYRSLPQICLVGKATDTAPAPADPDPDLVFE
jgi:vancomycin resistance protein YoaR